MKDLLVLLHGAAGTKAAWLPQINGLADEADVIALDLPAHGQRNNQPFSFAAASALVADAIVGAGRTSAVVLGLSLGGYVAMDFASRYPDRVDGLVLSGCTIDYSQPRKRVLIRVNRAAIALWPKRLLAGLQAKALRSEYPDWAEEMIAAGFFFGGFAQALGPLSERYFPAALQDAPFPIMLIEGERDTQNRREEPRFLSTARRAELVVLKGATHLCNLDDPAGFNAAVSDFIRRIAADRATT